MGEGGSIPSRADSSPPISPPGTAAFQAAIVRLRPFCPASPKANTGCGSAFVVYPGTETYPIDHQITAMTLHDVKERLIQL